MQIHSTLIICDTDGNVSSYRQLLRREEVVHFSQTKHWNTRLPFMIPLFLLLLSHDIVFLPLVIRVTVQIWRRHWVCMRNSWESSRVPWTSPKRWFVCPPTWSCILLNWGYWYVLMQDIIKCTVAELEMLIFVLPLLFTILKKCSFTIIFIMLIITQRAVGIVVW